MSLLYERGVCLYTHLEVYAAKYTFWRMLGSQMAPWKKEYAIEPCLDYRGQSFCLTHWGTLVHFPEGLGSERVVARWLVISFALAGS